MQISTGREVLKDKVVAKIAEVKMKTVENTVVGYNNNIAEMVLGSFVEFWGACIADMAEECRKWRGCDDVRLG